MGNMEIMNKTDATRETFWKLLSGSNYKIAIPRIQRDYAQGRQEQAPTQIRKNFLRDIFDSLENKTQLDINFVYGNTRESDSKTFIPIDGQQRLTTLFLLHWYFAAWAGKLDDENKKILERFQYETRFVTTEFCSKLVNDVEINLKDLIKTNKTIIDEIKDYYWFFSTYEYDASIKSMLVMLQEIHDYVKGLSDKAKVDTYFEILSSNDCPINFLFLNIDDVGLTDEIYIKMNARGKALTRFENYKAQLTAYLAKKDKDFSNEFLDKLNGDWSQFFWHKEYRPDIDDPENKGKKKKASVFDDQIMNLFKFIISNEYFCNVDLSSDGRELKYLSREIVGGMNNENENVFFNKLFIDGYKKVASFIATKDVVDENCFKFIYTLLNILKKKRETCEELKFADFSIYDKVYMDEDNLFRRVIKSVEGKSLSLQEQILLYGEFCFLVKYSEKDYSFNKSKELAECLRVLYNMLTNTLNMQNDDFFRAIRTTRQIIDAGNALDIKKYLSSILKTVYKQSSDFGFQEERVEEECIKAILISSSVNWKLQIEKSEKSFLNTQLIGLLAFSGIKELYEEEMKKIMEANPEMEMLPEGKVFLLEASDTSEYYTKYNDYREKIDIFFDKKDVKQEMEEKSIMRRALLTFGGKESYMLPSRKDVRCFLDATNDTRGFWRLLRDDNENRAIFKDFLDAIDIKQEIKPQLEKMISSATFDEESMWKKYFVEMPELLDCMYQNKDKYDPSKNFVFKDAKRYICKHDVNRVLLLEKTMTTSVNRELYSYVLYLKAKQAGCNVAYYTDCNENSEKYLTYTNKNNENLQVVYAKDPSDNNKYKYLTRKPGMEFPIMSGTLEDTLKFIQQSNK